jgi:ferredoxin-thioredoxin reductase catalytic subunit
VRDGRRGKKLAEKGEVVSLEALQQKRDVVFQKDRADKQQKVDKVRAREAKEEVQRDVERTLQRKVTSNAASAAAIAEEVEDRRQRLARGYCWCRVVDADGEGEGMISCDAYLANPDRIPPCPGNGWYHFSHVGLTPEQGETYLNEEAAEKKWNCEFCSNHPDVMITFKVKPSWWVPFHHDHI